jgi:hypothetical protein
VVNPSVTGLIGAVAEAADNSCADTSVTSGSVAVICVSHYWLIACLSA